MHCHTGSAPGILVWGGFYYRTPLVHIAGTLNSQHYISEVLELVVLPYIQLLPSAIFLQDNLGPHAACNVQEFFFTHPMELLPWPACIADLISCISSSVDSCLTRTPNEKKKRRGMPSSVSAHEFLEVPVSNIPSTNLNFQVYKNWVPGAILGRSGEGIISPTKTCVNAEKWGLEYVYKNSENIILPSSVIYANTGSPPPPPLSPQSLVIKKENDF
ncbi:UNVERIFIED_CONTAM: hypothetical protein NCL1_25808 [Trichonephila clavipes]